VDVVHPVARELGDLQGVAATYHEVAGVKAQPGLAALQKAPELVVALDHGTVVVVQRDGDPMPGADLLHRGQGLEQLPPRAIVQFGDLLVALRARGRGQDHHVGPGGGEEPRAPLDEGQLRLAGAGVVQHGRHETPDEAQAVPGQDLGHLGGLPRQQPFWPRLHGRQTERRRLAEHPVGGHLVAPVRDLDDPPGHRGARYARPSVHRITPEPSLS